MGLPLWFRNHIHYTKILNNVNGKKVGWDESYLLKIPGIQTRWP
jgi:hypothetical protein